jgi:hypothetical protein
VEKYTAVIKGEMRAVSELCCVPFSIVSKPLVLLTPYEVSVNSADLPKFIKIGSLIRHK